MHSYKTVSDIATLAIIITLLVTVASTSPFIEKKGSDSEAAAAVAKYSESVTSTPPASSTTTTRAPPKPYQPLSIPCNRTQDCLNHTTFSRCYRNQCICLFGYEFTGGQCTKVNCIFNTDCTRLFAHTSCHQGGGCVCDYFHALDRDSQTCSETNFLNLAIFTVLASFFFAILALIGVVLCRVTVMEWIVQWRAARRGYENVHAVN